MSTILSALTYSIFLSFLTLSAAIASSSEAASFPDEEIPAGSMIAVPSEVLMNDTDEVAKPQATLGDQPETTPTSPPPAPSPYARLVPHWKIPGETVSLQFLMDSGKLKGFNPIGRSDTDIVAEVNRQQFWHHPNTTNVGHVLHHAKRKIRKIFR